MRWSWLDSCLEHGGAGILGGVTFGQWRRLLRENDYRVDPRYWPRAQHITALSLLNSLAACREERRFGRTMARTEVAPPLFVLGVWRSGTSHLHNLLARDPRFAYPNLYDVLNPSTFLGGGRRGARVLDRIVPRTRMMDGMKQGAFEPQEEEIALAGTGLTSMLALVFPRSGQRYWRYLTLAGAPAADVVRWQEAYLHFIRKLTLREGRPLVLKSPANSGRIRLLLELFPGAKFVTVHRDPYEVFQSARHSRRATESWWQLQTGGLDEGQLLRDYAELFDAYFAQRGLVPAGDLCEVAYADLVRAPLATVERIYESLSLPDFTGARPALQRYLVSVASYRRNRYPALSDRERDRVRREWGRSFREWGYAARPAAIAGTAAVESQARLG